MKPRLLVPVLLTLAASAPLQAGFTWVTDTNNPYTAGTAHTFFVDGPGYANDIFTDFMVNHDGTVGTNIVGSPGPDSKIVFYNADPLVAGDTLTFMFNMSVMLESDPTVNSTRLAAQFQHFGVVDPLTGTPSAGAPGMDVEVTLSGGNNTLASYANLPASLDSGTDGNGDTKFIENTGILRSRGQNSTFNGITGNTGSYTTSAFGVGGGAGFFIADQQRASRDLSFQKATYEVTLLGNLDAGSKFQWTFGGHDAVIDPIPEPSRALLLGLASLACLLRRRR